MDDFCATEHNAAQTPCFNVVFKPIKMRVKYRAPGKRSRRVRHEVPHPQDIRNNIGETQAQILQSQVLDVLFVRC